MNNLRSVSKATKGISYSSRVPLYYSISDDAAYTTPGPGRIYVTDLIRENTELEIKATINRWLDM